MSHTPNRPRMYEPVDLRNHSEVVKKIATARISGILVSQGPAPLVDPNPRSDIRPPQEWNRCKPKKASLCTFFPEGVAQPDNHC